MANLEQTDGLAQPRRWWAVFALCCGNAVVMIDGTIANVALPTIASDLRIADSEAVLVITVYQLSLVMTLLPMSALGDRFGHRKVYQYGLILFSVATALCFFAKALPLLLIARVGQAIGAAATLSVSAALVRSVYPARLLGRGLAINTVTVFLAAAAAPSIGGLILSITTWPWVFGAAVPFALLSLLQGRALPESKPTDEPYDTFGATLCALMFGLIIGGLEALVRGAPVVIALLVLAAGIGVAVYYIRRSLGVKSPVLPLDLLRYPVIALSVAGALTAFTASMAFQLSVPFWLQQEFKYTPAEIGAVMSAWPLTLLFVAPLAGALSDKIPAGILGAIGMTLATLGLALLGTLPHDASHFSIVWRIVLCSLGFGFYFSPNARLILSSAPLHRAATAGGMVSTTRLTGQTLGSTLLAALLAMGMGAGRTPALVGAALTIVACVCSIARLRPIYGPSPGPHIDDV